MVNCQILLLELKEEEIGKLAVGVREGRKVGDGVKTSVGEAVFTGLTGVGVKVGEGLTFTSSVGVGVGVGVNKAAGLIKVVLGILNSNALTGKTLPIKGRVNAKNKNTFFI